MTWQVETVIDAKDDVAAQLQKAIVPQFKHQRDTVVRMGRKVEDMQAFWQLEDAQVARAVKAAVALREGHAGARLKLKIMGHCNADGSGSVGASVATVR